MPGVATLGFKLKGLMAKSGRGVFKRLKMQINRKLKKMVNRYNEPSLVISRELGKILTSILYMAVLDYTREPNLSNFNPHYQAQALRNYERYKHDAFLWFTSDDEGGSVHFSFRQCCDLLGLCPYHVRRKLNLIDQSQGYRISKTRRRV